MPDTTAIKDLARQRTRGMLAEAKSFHQLGRDEQLDLYRDLFRANVEELSRSSSAVPGKSRYSGALAEPKSASDMIDDERHLNKRIDQAGDLAGDFVDEVDFPGFVKDLLKGVFDANLAVTIQQMEAYQNLLKTATQSVSKFIKDIDETAAFGYLAENNSDEFNIDFAALDGDKKDDDGESSEKPAGNGGGDQRKMVLTDKEGNPVDLSDNAVKAKIMDAKIQMAREQRAMLREVILMGVTRLVVERGNVKASVIFDIKASERIQKGDQAALKEASSKSGSISASGGFIGSILGGVSGGGTYSDRKTKISVSSAKSTASSDLAAKITGSVDITFKSDYFKLDNFAQMYGPQPAAAAPGQPAAPVGSGAGAGAGAPAPALPAPPAR